MTRAAISASFALALAATLHAFAAEFLPQSDRVKGRSYSEAVVTEGGRVVWLAGQTALTDLAGKDIKGDFEAQTRTVFALIDETLKRTGGNLKDVVSMTVFLTDARNGPIFAKVRTEMFPDPRAPKSPFQTWLCPVCRSKSKRSP